MEKIFVIGLLFLLAAGCVNRSTAEKPDLSHRIVRIETDPPGMRIFFGYGASKNRAENEREYVGVSPCSYTANSTRNGYFRNTVSQFSKPVAVFYADPPSTETNLFSQRQTFNCPAFTVRPAPIPGAVFFDMHKKPANEAEGTK